MAAAHQQKRLNCLVVCGQAARVNAGTGTESGPGIATALAPPSSRFLLLETHPERSERTNRLAGMIVNWTPDRALVLAGPGLGGRQETTKVGGAREKARLFENFSILTETLNKCFNFQYVLFQIKGL